MTGWQDKGMAGGLNSFFFCVTYFMNSLQKEGILKKRLILTKLVNASPNDNRAPDAGSSKPLMFWVPIDVADPTRSKCERAIIALSASGVCNGPTHCC